MKQEIWRQFLHFLGILFIIPLIYLNYILSIKFLAFATLISIVIMAQLSATKKRQALLKKAIEKFVLLEEKRKQKLLKSIKRIEEINKLIVNKYIKPAMRSTESEMGWATFTFLFGVLTSLIFFGREIAIVAILTLSVGDAFSTVVGTAIGHHKLNYNKKKSLEGTITFFITSFTAVYLLLHYIPINSVSILYIAIIASISGAIAESLPELNDNISVPLIVGAVLFIILNYVI